MIFKIILLSLLLNSVFAVHYSLANVTNDNKTNILVITSSDQSSFTQMLEQKRKLFSNISITSIDVENESTIDNLIQSDVSQVYDEFWIITHEFSDEQKFSDLIIHLIDLKIFEFRFLEFGKEQL